MDQFTATTRVGPACGGRSLPELGVHCRILLGLNVAVPMLQHDDDGLHGNQGRDGQADGDNDILPRVSPVSSAHAIP
jgi:hypothetical protein